MAAIEALKKGRIGALGLDVYEEEGDYFFEDLSDRVAILVGGVSAKVVSREDRRLVLVVPDVLEPGPHHIVVWTEWTASNSAARV